MRIARAVLVAMLVLSVAPAESAATSLAGRCDRAQLWPGGSPQPVSSGRIESLTIGGEPVNVLLPPGYHRHGHRRYPVLYVLHGGGWSAEGGPNLWLNETNIVELTADGRDVIVVFPYGGSFGFYSDWSDGSQSWESYHIGTLIPAIDALYRTRPDRRFRALTGESMGGIGSLIYAGRHPDMFGAAFAFSGGATISEGIAQLLQAASPMFGHCAGATDIAGLWGYPLDELRMRAHDPAELAVNYGGVSLLSYMGSGRPCHGDDVEEVPQRFYPAFEAGLRPAAESLARTWQRTGIPFEADFPLCGTHSFRYISPALDRHWSELMASFGRPDPASFDYRAPASSFSVWDWTFTADAARAPEFLDIADASCHGLGLTGSGRTTVTTARCFEAGERVLVNGAEHSANARGRITFSVDLGPAHTQQQFTPAARALEAAGGYWTSKTVTFEGGGS